MKISHLYIFILSAFLLNFSSMAIAADTMDAKSTCLGDASKECLSKCDSMEAMAKRQCNKECRTKLSKEERACMKKNSHHKNHTGDDNKDSPDATKTK